MTYSDWKNDGGTLPPFDGERLMRGIDLVRAELAVSFAEDRLKKNLAALAYHECRLREAQRVVGF